MPPCSKQVTGAACARMPGQLTRDASTTTPNSAKGVRVTDMALAGRQFQVYPSQ